MTHKYTEVKLKIHTYTGCFKVRSDFFLRLNFLDYKNYFSKISMLFLIHFILKKKKKRKEKEILVTRMASFIFCDILGTAAIISSNFSLKFL